MTANHAVVMFSFYQLLTKSAIVKLLTVKVSQESEHITAISPGSQYGLWHWTVLLFSLRNGPSIFQSKLKNAFNDLELLSSSMDNLFIYSEDKQQDIEQCLN